MVIQNVFRIIDHIWKINCSGLLPQYENKGTCLINIKYWYSRRWISYCQRHSIRPTLYLSFDAKVTGGDGVSTNPYQISL